jgi:hypothetical protein
MKRGTHASILISWVFLRGDYGLERATDIRAGIDPDPAIQSGEGGENQLQAAVPSAFIGSATG